MKTTEIQGSRILIVGYGREGKSVHAWLKQHYPDAKITIADKKTDGDGYLDHIAEYDTVIRSPGVPARLLAKARHVTTATNIFFSLVVGKTIGVTGTKGKSTTSSLIAHILKTHFSDVRLVGNIGIPMLDHLEGASADTVFVIELSSHQLEDIRYSPHVAVILNIVPEHLDYYPDFDSYKRAKANIVQYQEPSDVVIYGTSVEALAAGSRGQKIPIVDVPLPDSSLLGNKENKMAALSVAHAFDVSEEHIKQAFATFSPLPHRLELVGEFGGITFYNDSLATIPEAAIHALATFGDRVGTLIAGGYDRHIDFTALGAYLATHPVDTLILFPDTGEKIWAAIMAANPDTTIQKYGVSSMEDAVKLAYTHTLSGKICLLSPASASYNLFRDYADRGDQFRQWVEKCNKDC